ncbi:MAG: methionine synthase [Chloroflexi bacterium RBG_16_56_11]|nr:MAG: methionine synthase [Chloroflexi bacterium RBG_16_56_11]
MSIIEFNCLPTNIGSLPYTDPVKACSVVARHLKDIPVWPQLPRRSFLENLYVQASEGFPGLVVEVDRVYVNTAADFQKPLEELYAAYLENDIGRFPIGRDHAAGLYEFLGKTDLTPRAVKGQVIGPLSWGLTVTDENRRAILYHEILGDAVPKFLKLKAAWMERELARVSKNTIIFVDEPIMASYGSIVATGPFSNPEKIAGMINEVFEGIRGLKGTHCCGNTDWSVLLKTNLDILNFDAYSYAESVSLYPEEIKRFLARGGCIAWGIVPNDAESIGREMVASLKDRLEEAMAPFTRHGVRFRDLAAQSLITPRCGLDGLTEDGAEKVLELLTGLSGEMRRKYGL